MPVDDTARTLIERLLFLRTLPPAPTPNYLLPRPRGRNELLIALRTTLTRAAAQAGLSGHIVPHQLRHTYATSLLRAGVSLPALMRLLGHHNANMTLIYVEVTQQDLHREYHLARQNPRYLVPSPPALWLPQPANMVVSLDDALQAAIRILQAHRDTFTPGTSHKLLVLLARRLARIRALAAKLFSDDQREN